MRQITIRYLARDGRAKTLCYFGEVAPGEWRLHQQTMNRKASQRMREQARDTAPNSAYSWAAAVTPHGQRAKRPAVVQDAQKVIFDGYFTIPNAKLWPVLTRFADHDQDELDISTLRIAVDRGSM